MACLDVLKKAVIVDRGGEGQFRFRCAEADFHDVSGFQVIGLRKITSADGRSLEVEENGYVCLEFRGLPADAEDDFPDPVVLGMAHVEPEDVGSGLDKAAQHVGGIRCRSNGADDFCGAKPGRRTHGLCQCPYFILRSVQMKFFVVHGRIVACQSGGDGRIMET